MATAPAKNAKAIIQDEKDVKESIETPTSVITTNSLNAPKHGTVIPNRVFVGGICSATTEAELMSLFSHYGTVIGAKIIADRAGVSKGYGFVTFETEEEAKRLQKDANNIVLRERRLNIAPAIKKQGYGRAPSYDCSPTTPVAMPSQVFRQNGIAYTFHNGMAFFPQPPPQPLTPQHMEPTVYQQGTPFGAVPQGSPAPAYQYPYSQGQQVIYQAHPQYQYHIPPFESCYDPQVMMHDANMLIPQYYLAAQPGHEMAYYAPTQLHPQEPSPSLQHPIIYPPRTFDSAIVYSSEPSTMSEASMVQVQEADASAPNPVTTTTTGNNQSNNEITSTSTPANENNRRGRETPVVSLLKVQGKENTNGNNHNNNTHKVTSSQNYQQVRRKPRQFEDYRRSGHLNNNNNSPDAANRNLVSYCPPPQQQHHHQHQQHQQQRGNRRDSGASGEELTSYPRPPSVPSFPFYRHPAPNIHSFYPQPPPHRTRTVFHRPPRYAGGVPRGGRGHHGYQQPARGEGGRWKEEESQPLTPPITPKSEAGRAATPAQPEELVKSMQTVAI